MNTKIYLCLIPFFLMACNQSNSYKAEKKIKGGVYSQYLHDSDLQYIKVFGKNSRLEEEGDLYRGKKDGTWTSYHEGELVKEIISYKDGIKQGPYFRFSLNGEMTEKAWYANGKLNGRYVKYKFRRIIEEKVYSHGKLNGPVTIYYPNGEQLKESSFYFNGKIDGLARWYNEQGDVIIESTYKNGELIEQKTGDEIPSNSDEDQE